MPSTSQPVISRKLRRLTARVVAVIWFVRKLVHDAMRAALTLVPLSELPHVLETFLDHLGPQDSEHIPAFMAKIRGAPG